MSGGYNKKFMKSPDKFLSDHAIDIWPMGHTLSIAPGQPGALESGVCSFDLFFDEQWQLAKLTTFNDRPEEADTDKPIQAYWLPWNPDGKSRVSFGTLKTSKVKYLFTSSLAGCRIVITESELYHISGQLSQDQRSEKTDRIANRSTRARAFSSSTGNAYGVSAFIVGYKSRKGWKFVAQSASVPEGARVYEISSVFRNSDFIQIK